MLLARPLDEVEASAGPVAPANFAPARALLQAELGEAITLDGLTGSWFIFQRARGHRHSIDDVLTARYALALKETGVATRTFGAEATWAGLAALVAAWKALT